jgi:UDP-N-acetylmuramoylalanine--D-glutamate ligase
LIFRDKTDYEDSIRVDKPDPGLLPACCAAASMHISLSAIYSCIQTFPGIPHRFEFIGKHRGISFFNDSASTIPEAVLYAVQQLNGPVHLITGGTDKQLCPEILLPALLLAETIHLLAGTFTDRLLPIVRKNHLFYKGPFTGMEDALQSALKTAEPGSNIILSPGSASFEYFEHEFDRGDRFTAAVKRCLQN